MVSRVGFMRVPLTVMDAFCSLVDLAALVVMVETDGCAAARPGVHVARHAETIATKLIRMTENEVDAQVPPFIRTASPFLGIGRIHKRMGRQRRNMRE